jgi:hypothetical protein
MARLCRHGEHHPHLNRIPDDNGRLELMVVRFAVRFSPLPELRIA